MKITLQSFIEKHPPHQDNVKASDELINFYKEYVPQSLLELWKECGFGLYSNGLIQVINPERYKKTLWAWLMRDEDDEDMSRIPIALSAFGDIFYYRLLSDEGDEDVSYIDPHISDVGVLNWSLNDFFNDWCCDQTTISDFLKQEMFEEAVAMHGPLQSDQMYCFTPALRLGGVKSVKSIKHGDAVVHLDFLQALALDD